MSSLLFSLGTALRGIRRFRACTNPHAVRPIRRRNYGRPMSVSCGAAGGHERRKLGRFFASLLIIGTASMSAANAAAIDGNRTFVAPPPQSTVTPFDSGAIARSPWQKAFMATGFIDFTTRTPAQLATTAYFLYDATNLYIAFVCARGDVPLTAAQTTNNVGFGLDDDVEFDVDPTDNGTRTYAFESTPRGVRYQTSSESSRYDPPWTARARIMAKAWVVEMIVPLRDLRAGSGAVQTWRINFARHVAARAEDYTWAYDPLQNSLSDSSHWPRLGGIRIAVAAARPAPHGEVYALASAGRDRKQFQNQFGAFEQQTPRLFGIDGTYPITNTLALVGTLNPDFSNVEVDQQIIAPQEFRRAYTEYRPFFSQGANFLTPGPGIGINTIASTPFYTPSIGTFDRGIKLEGTTGPYTLGALEVRGAGLDDEAFGIDRTSSDRTLELFTSGVLAHHSDLGNDSTLGFGGTISDRTRTFSLGVNEQMERGSLVGNSRLAHNLLTLANYQNQATQVSLSYRDIGPEYNPIDGYTQQNDIRGPQLIVLQNGVFKAARSQFKSYSLVGFADRYVDRSGAARQVDAFAQGGVTLKSLLSLTVSQQTSSLRQYTAPYPVYSGGVQEKFDQTSFALGYRDGTASPIDFLYAFGPYASFCPGTVPQALFCAPSGAPGFIPSYVTLFTASASRQIGRFYSLAGEIDSSSEQPYSGTRDGQWLRRLALTRSLGSDASISLGLRTISGTGGFGAPGTNFVASFHVKFRDSSQLYFEYGTPAATATLNRAVLKYELHLGGGIGT